MSSTPKGRVEEIAARAEKAAAAHRNGDGCCIEGNAAIACLLSKAITDIPYLLEINADLLAALRTIAEDFIDLEEAGLIAKQAIARAKGQSQ